ncbi:hypothetical protein F4678DRAFT_454950 [Xylaria arbuscula]|nr:hypothetical protein F4678DRAFT_454950 [Xylaria arbuscula]
MSSRIGRPCYIRTSLCRRAPRFLAHPGGTTVESFRRPRGMFFTWDPRVSEACIDHALRDAPGDAPGDGNKVTLATPRYQEAFTYFRSFYLHECADGTINREDASDFDPTFDHPQEVRYFLFIFYRSEDYLVIEWLPNVRPFIL